MPEGRNKWSPLTWQPSTLTQHLSETVSSKTKHLILHRGRIVGLKKKIIPNVFKSSKLYCIKVASVLRSCSTRAGLTGCTDTKALNWQMSAGGFGVGHKPEHTRPLGYLTLLRSSRSDKQDSLRRPPPSQSYKSAGCWYYCIPWQVHAGLRSPPRTALTADMDTSCWKLPTVITLSLTRPWCMRAVINVRNLSLIPRPLEPRGQRQSPVCEGPSRDVYIRQHAGPHVLKQGLQFRPLKQAN